MSADIQPSSARQTKQTNESRDEGRSPEVEVRALAAALENPTQTWVRVGAWQSSWGCAMACRVEPGRTAHVVGASRMAEGLRAMFACGAVEGWALHPMPSTRTPLEDCAEQLAGAGGPKQSRYYNFLRRNEFFYVEEVQACPDEALLALHGGGRRFLSAVRKALGTGDLTPSTTPLPASLTLRRRPADGHFTAVATARYPEFARHMEVSGMPSSTKAAIRAVINAEPLPPSDPLIVLLLETAKQDDLLALYRGTHATAADPSAP